MAIGGDRAALQSPASTTSTAFRPARTARTAEEFSFAYMAGVLSPRRPASEGGVGSAGSNGKASQPAAASAKGTGFFLSRQAPNASGTEVAPRSVSVAGAGIPGQQQQSFTPTTSAEPGNAGERNPSTSQGTSHLIAERHASQEQLASCMQEMKQLSSVNRLAEQLHSSKVAELNGQLQAAMARVNELEADLADARQGLIDMAMAIQQQQEQQQQQQQHKGSIDDGGEGVDDQQQSTAVQQPGIKQAAANSGDSECLQDTWAGCDEDEEEAALWDADGCYLAESGDELEDTSCEGCNQASEQVADLAAQLQQAQSKVEALDAELAAARQQAGQAWGSAVFARSQVKTLSCELQAAVGKIVVLENAAAGWKQHAAHANKELQVLREAAAAAADAHAVSATAAAADKQCSRLRSDLERAWLRQQLAKQRRTGLQLQAQLEASKSQVEELKASSSMQKLPLPAPLRVAANAPATTDSGRTGSAGLIARMAAQCCSTTEGGEAQSPDSMHSSGFSIGGLLRMAKRAAIGEK
ncbi:hypothetical protein OEZ86_004742 [Tetradesmus obliquus]|nr:hypothetical protein OEZ86_004742 [Tetradesmus obliquus]